MDEHGSAAPQAGFVANAGAFARNLFALLVTRVELAALELGEARDHLARLFVVGALGVLLVCFALVAWTALIVVLAWDALGWKVLLLVALAYSGAAVAALLRARRMLA
ncbi:MAG TPA: phage holin family protein, partial [Noviherbaspirillum sp.]